MRTIRYAVFNKETNERIYTDCRYKKCVEKINSMENKEKFEIRYKWVSI